MDLTVVWFVQIVGTDNLQTCQGWERKMHENSGVEARRVEIIQSPKGRERGGEVLWEGSSSPPPHQLVGLGECCMLPR